MVHVNGRSRWTVNIKGWYISQTQQIKKAQHTISQQAGNTTKLSTSSSNRLTHVPHLLHPVIITSHVPHPVITTSHVPHLTCHCLHYSLQPEPFSPPPQTPGSQPQTPRMSSPPTHKTHPHTHLFEECNSMALWSSHELDLVCVCVCVFVCCYITWLWH